MIGRPPSSTLFPYTTLSRSALQIAMHRAARRQVARQVPPLAARLEDIEQAVHDLAHHHRAPTPAALGRPDQRRDQRPLGLRDRKSTRLNSSHANISYAVFCL